MEHDSEWKWLYDYAKQARLINKIVGEMFNQVKREDGRKVKIYLKNPATQQITELTEAVELITLEIS